jgi:centromere protein C
MYKVRSNKPGEFRYQKIFGEEEFFAAGVLHIPVGIAKEAKNSRDNAYVSPSNRDPLNGFWLNGRRSQSFWVHKGCVQVQLHTYRFLVAEGGMFMVPRGEWQENLRQLSY